MYLSINLYRKDTISFVGTCTTKPLEIFRVDFCSESNTNSKGKHHGCSNQSRYYSTQTTFLRSRSL
ncbi:hypothetical protein T08_10918 [Trichinella sp. T8]|uniref:Uncharacterized protein n=1 Tax=Trichinella murrelli TaxID=144512 RepID=A0A0V0UGB6_9BILA|nr:hypothetical protein T05_8748 [Trichinella murrelli]KRZ95442.1 hypothetical protein T08_10918 [Trichinella sp. T8]